MRKYETVLIWSASLSEAELKKETGRVQEIVTDGGGELTGFDDWGRRQLAYLINKESEGVYHFVHWKGSSEVKLAIDKMLRINDNCLRHLTLKDDRDTVRDSVDDSPAFDAGE
ncbi:MAG: 30S ribosomal protein S6 [Gemmatimonadaceae bacterium 4484_173]|nr:MAG: 30S ribosomal protein S6 [Gemmatimonadaceae bacterium 4484_173]RKZ02395.1 MAG: 30S ribosomal protein S6 [Candidatus Fermentibacteria bacterium]